MSLGLASDRLCQQPTHQQHSAVCSVLHAVSASAPWRASDTRARPAESPNKAVCHTQLSQRTGKIFCVSPLALAKVASRKGYLDIPDSGGVTPVPTDDPLHLLQHSSRDITAVNRQTHEYSCVHALGQVRECCHAVRVRPSHGHACTLPLSRLVHALHAPNWPRSQAEQKMSD